MHPPLARHKHKACLEVPPPAASTPQPGQAIDALEKCHREQAVGKFFGACNALKDALDKCLREEKKPIRKKALEEARASRAKWERAKAERAGQQ